MSTEHEMEKLERSEKSHTSTKLDALFADLDKNAYEAELHKYWIKQANQIIRTHFEELEASNKVFAIGFAEWLKTNAYSKNSSWYLHEAMDGNIYSESELIAKYEKYMEESKQNTLVFIKETEGKYTIRFNKENGNVFMGELIREVDGQFYWFPVAFKGSCVSEHTIKLIQEKLSELNIGFTDEVKNYLMEISTKEYKLNDDVSDKFDKDNTITQQDVTGELYEEKETMKSEVDTEIGEFFLIKKNDEFWLKYKQDDLEQNKPLDTEKDHVIYKGVTMALKDFSDVYHAVISEKEVEELAFAESKKRIDLDNLQRQSFQEGYESGMADCMKFLKNRKYTEEDMINMAKYGYEFRDTTQFPKQTFEENCINNTKQLMQSLYSKKDYWRCTYGNEIITIIE